MQHATAALAAPQVLRHARRALLLLGAAFAWWLLFSGAPAHAEDTSGGHVTPAVQAKPSTPGTTTQQVVSRTTATVTGKLRTAPRQVTDAVTSTTRTAPAPVRNVVRTVTTAVEPTLTATTTAVAGSVDRTVRTVQDAAQPALDVVVPAADAAPAPAAIAPVTQRVPGAHTTQRTAESQPAYAVADSAPTSHRADAVQTPGNSTPGGVPAGPTAPVAQGAGGAPAGPLAAFAGLLLLPVSARRRRRFLDRALLLPDAVYPPGCSPD